MDIAAILTAIAALMTAVGHAYNCERRIKELEAARDLSDRRYERVAGGLSALEKTLAEQSGSYRPPQIR